MPERLPEAWRSFLRGFSDEAKLEETLCRVAEKRAAGRVYPPSGMIFRAFAETPPAQVKAVLLGQDPYHEEGQAEGLAFSVPAGVKFPPSLRNVFKEYQADLGAAVPASGSLLEWARHGVPLLNSVLSVSEGQPGSHAKLGWQSFTDAVIAALSAQKTGLVFLLWGNYAQSKRPLIDETKHAVLAAAHPSPLSASRGFFGSKPFSQSEKILSPWRWPRDFGLTPEK